jgi:hypothetical protein
MKGRIEILISDITKQHVDAIVNAANRRSFAELLQQIQIHNYLFT